MFVAGGESLFLYECVFAAPKKKTQRTWLFGTKTVPLRLGEHSTASSPVAAMPRRNMLYWGLPASCAQPPPLLEALDGHAELSSARRPPCAGENGGGGEACFFCFFIEEARGT